MNKKYYCPVCGYESDEPIDVCPLCGAKMAVREECASNEWAAEHKVGIIDGVDEEIVKGLRDNFNGECSEVGMYLAMARVAHREGYPVIGLINGFFVAKFSLHPFIVTLSTQLITYGIILWFFDFNNGAPIGGRYNTAP